MTNALIENWSAQPNSELSPRDFASGKDEHEPGPSYSTN